ncbi:MAG: DUF819 family protein [Prevotellaceae bacterium]|jgi:uncharacterized membrane protein|nr:DUF819 family protein [Prevotellaceae bacterium]
MMLPAIFITLYLATPVSVLLLCRKFKPMQKIGEVLLAYFAGIFLAFTIWVLAQCGLVGGDSLAALRRLQASVCDAVIPFAIPLMLFSANLRHVKKQLRGASLTLLSGVLAVVCVTVAGAFVFAPHIPDMSKIAGLVTGVETGGTPNMAALQFALKVPENTFMQLQASDMVVCFFYLLFIFSVGKALLRKFLPAYKSTTSAAAQSGEAPYAFTLSRRGLLQVLQALGLSAAVVLVGIGSSLLLLGAVHVPYLMLTITTLSLAASFAGPVRRLRCSFDVGMFLVLIFNVTIASMVDFSQLLNAEMYYILGYVACCVFGSLTLHALLCKCFGVDADTFMVSSAALINSPPFVPVVAMAIGNRQVVLVGISVGIVGYAVGNYLGFTVAEVLKNFL